MIRAIAWEEVVDTSTFSAIQLQPGKVASLTWNALARWLRTYLVTLPSLIRDEATGLVVIGFHLDYRDPISFFECDSFQVRAAFRALRRGEQGQLDLQFTAGGNELAIAQLLVRPVTIVDPISLGAEPSPLSEALLARFNDDEVASSSAVRIVPPRLSAVETTGQLLSEQCKPFQIHRHRSEVAEQWSWTEVPALVESARECVALETTGHHRKLLRRALNHRLSRFDVEFCRPYFSFESGDIVSRAYDVAGHLAFVHRFTSNRGAHLHATVVEVFES